MSTKPKPKPKPPEIIELDAPAVAEIRQRIALSFTGRKHAGENLRDVLTQRAKQLAPPIQMCDPLSRNMPAELNTILANCLAHGRRQFVDVVEHFPDECRYVLEALKVVYQNDTVARQKQLSPEARLQFHKSQSGPVMDDLQAWLQRQIDEHLVEPNSGLGEAIIRRDMQRVMKASRTLLGVHMHPASHAFQPLGGIRGGEIEPDAVVTAN